MPKDKQSRVSNTAPYESKIILEENHISTETENLPNLSASNSTMSNPTIPTIPTAPDVNAIFQSLRIPDAIKDLPLYDGNPRSLYDFIKNVEEILVLLPQIDGTPYANVILRAVRNKIVGDANEVLNMYGTPTNWDTIKANLILHYADKRNETSLIRDLHGLRQTTETIEQFYAKVIELLSTIVNHVQIHEKLPSVVTAKKSLFTDMCLNTFLIGLKEPLGSTIRAMKPKTLTEAFNYCVQEQNMFYMKYSTTQNKFPSQNMNNQNVSLIKPSPSSNLLFSRPNKSIQPNFNNSSPQHLFKNLQYNQLPQYRPIQQSAPRLQYPAQQQFNNRFSVPSNNMLTSKPFNQLHYNSTPRPNFNFNKPQINSTPMEVASGQARTLPTPVQNHPYQRNFSQPVPRYSIKEVHNIDYDPETNNDYDYYQNSNDSTNYEPNLDYYVEQYEDNISYQYDISNQEIKSENKNEIDDSNFHIKASENNTVS